ncbi:conserved hypothetical protein [Ricinus communis]|uniref:Uncharacterized protein n=1 Tax=Ricinus communis TaxID=3988 RepID=B9SPZ9_RICCO|nr:conserved hypothetical protein [Ricinus communis]
MAGKGTMKLEPSKETCTIKHPSKHAEGGKSSTTRLLEPSQEDRQEKQALSPTLSK